MLSFWAKPLDSMILELEITFLQHEIASLYPNFLDEHIQALALICWGR
jgi:hypothetical protein